MEPVGAALMVLVLGGVMFGLDQERRKSLRRTRVRAETPAPSPSPGPLPSPPGPEPEPEPEPEPDEGYIDIPRDQWKDTCWWGMKGEDALPDIDLKVGESYYTTWSSQWQGEEDHLVYVDPPHLADVEARAVWGDDGILFIEAVITPRDPQGEQDWGWLMTTEGTPGAGATKGETPWRTQCMKIQVS